MVDLEVVASFFFFFLSFFSNRDLERTRHGHRASSSVYHSVWYCVNTLKGLMVSQAWGTSLQDFSEALWCHVLWELQEGAGTL